MDTDDCDETTKSKYISGELFEGHPLKEYIVPVYNVSNLEDVMIKAGIMAGFSFFNTINTLTIIP